ncbi:D-2-hydroxyacid dehydrogenase [Paenibacillus sp. TAB 01]|uniref:D-2-hydroxyacid dehydrogenase n=1 Tax=Paenibacillus sp. TAB 01 TaxID=3368988 RepID=UPI00375259BD
MSTIQNIVVTGRMYRELEPLLRQRSDKSFRFLAEADLTAEDYDWTDAFVGFRPPPGFRLEGLQWVHALGAGVDAFVHSREWLPGVLLTRTIGVFGRQISEYCLSYMLAEAQHHGRFRAQQRERSWVPHTPRPLAGQTAVIFGTGTIGQEVARQLSFFGMQVSGVSRSGGRKPYFASNVTLASCTGLLESADWVINTLPLTRETNQLFDERLFGAMKQSGFIHVGRGASVKPEALLRALDAGQVRLAVLDVFAEEPLAESSPLWDHPGIIVTPHISAVTGPEEAAADFLKVLDGVDKGMPPKEHLVDLQQGY